MLSDDGGLEVADRTGFRSKVKWEGWEMQVEEVDGKNEEVRRERRSIQATPVGPCLQLASEVWMCSRGFFVVQCRRGEQGRQSGLLSRDRLGRLGCCRSGHSTCSAASQRQDGLA